jgi:hypothetical protein
MDCGNGFFTTAIFCRRWHDLLVTIDCSLCLLCALALPCSSLSHLASLSCAFANGGSFIHFLTPDMARVKNTTPFLGATIASAGEGHESEGSAKRIESV